MPSVVVGAAPDAASCCQLKMVMLRVGDREWRKWNEIQL